MVKTNGFYVSKPKEWGDSTPSGQTFQGINYHGILYLPDGRVIRALSQNREIAKDDFFGENSSLSFYEQQDAETIIMEFYRGTQFNMKVIYKLLNSDLLVDDKGLEYHFVPVDEAELQAAIEELDQKASESDD
ncbi:MAG: hypothetical protein GVY26_08425 [Bacteroidetes bacterium]|jgi:hypothetical protein|nr:hypothetical protein [Bacteroidota bacterium]